MRKQNNINSARKAYGYDFERNLQNLINNTNFRRKTSLRKPEKPEFMPTPPKHPYQKPGQSPFMPTPPKHPYQKPGQSPFMPSPYKPESRTKDVRKKMRKQNIINPAIANDPNDPLKRIIQRERTQKQSGSGNNDYISPEQFARKKGYLPGGIKRPRRTPTYEGQMPFNVKPMDYRPKNPMTILINRLIQESKLQKRPNPLTGPEFIRFGKNMSKRAIPTQRTDNTRNKYGI